MDIIQSNPHLKKSMLTILSFCKEADRSLERSSLEEAVLECWSEKCTQSPTALVDALIRCEALKEDILVNGEEYRGSIDDIRKDSTITEDAEVSRMVNLTEQGRSLLTQYAPTQEIKSLFEEKPKYSAIFYDLLSTCANSEGASRDKLEKVIAEHGDITCEKETGKVRVYPQYFIDALESAGGIEWDGIWKITSAGLAYTQAH